jgi:hypothetical protein
MSTLTLADVLRAPDGTPVTARKGTGVRHYVLNNPDSVDVLTLHRTVLGTGGVIETESSDAALCKVCTRIMDGIRERGSAQATLPEADTAPEAPKEPEVVPEASGPVVDYASLVSAVTVKINAARSANRCALCAMDERSSARCKVAKDGRHVTRSGRTGVYGKCMNPGTGEPVSARNEEDAVFPVEGSVQDRSAGGPVPERVNLRLPMTGKVDGNGTGLCPFCTTRVRLSGKGFVTAHTVRAENLPVAPPRVRLAERMPEIVATRAVSGSPDKSERVRDAELRGAQMRDWHPPMLLPDVTATVVVRMRVPAEGGKGKPRLKEMRVPATLQNVRTAWRQEHAKEARKSKKTGDMVGGPDQKVLARLSALLRGLSGLQSSDRAMDGSGARVREAATYDAPNAPEGREERTREDGRNGHVATRVMGAALVPGRSMSGEVPSERDRQTRKGKPRNAIGWSEPVGRMRPDAGALNGNAQEVCGGRGCTVKGCTAIVGGERYGFLECHYFRAQSRSRQARYWQKVKTAKEHARRAREYAGRPVDAARHAGAGNVIAPGGHGTVTGAPSRAGIQRVK